MLVDIRLSIPPDPQGIATSEQVLDELVEAIQSCGRRRFWLPPGSRVEGVELSMQELTEA